jgi:hypothetical protein
MVLVIALHNLPKPWADVTRAMMLPILKLCLDDMELRNHSLLRRHAPDLKAPLLVRFPQKCVNLRNVKVLIFRNVKVLIFP